MCTASASSASTGTQAGRLRRMFSRPSPSRPTSGWSMYSWICCTRPSRRGVTVPYSTIKDLPPDVRNHLTPDEQRQWLAVFNQVLGQTIDEEKAYMAAWGAVRRNRRLSARAVIVEDGRLSVRGWGMLFTDASHPDLLG